MAHSFRGVLAVLLLSVGLVALAHWGAGGVGRVTSIGGGLVGQRLESLEGDYPHNDWPAGLVAGPTADGDPWQVDNTIADDHQQVAAGKKRVNKAHINWYWIPPKPEPPSTGVAARLDASAALAGDPDADKSNMSPLVLDHVFTEEEGRQGWANVHAFEHGELLTGQVRLLHRPAPPPPPLPPQKHVHLDAVLHDVMDEAIATAFSNVMSEPPPPPSPPAPGEEGREEGKDEGKEGESEERATKTRRKSMPISDPASHLPFENENIERWHRRYKTAHAAHHSMPPTPPTYTDEEVARKIADGDQREERREERGVKGKEETGDAECSSQIYTELGCCCDIPFEYGGISHDNCTLLDHTRFWCYVQDSKCGLLEESTGQWWDHCYPKPAAIKKKVPPKHFYRKHHSKHKPGAYCGKHGHHTQPWHYHNFCNDDEVCNYRCKDQRCIGCTDNNCKCIVKKPLGETCGDGTRRGPEYSGMECLSGKCAYACDLCFDCDGGNCLCVKPDLHVRGT